MSFTQGVFKDLTHVVSLVLLQCGFETLDPQFFDGMTSLRLLRASSYQFSSLNAHNRTWSVNLDEMFLGLYQCPDVTEYAFRGLHNLTKIVIHYKCKGYNIYSLKINLAKLRYFYFKSSALLRPFFSLDAPNLKDFRYSCKSKSIQYDYNAWELDKAAESIEIIHLNAFLKAFEIMKNKSRGSLFTDMPKLIFLNFSKNELVYLYPATFKNLSSLRSLDLTRNKMEAIAPDAFMGLISLETLNLSDNALFFLPDEFAINLKSLQNLHLDLDELRNVGNESFDPATGLTTLILANNIFEEFNRSSLQPLFSSLTSVDISGNKFVCNCKLKWLVEEIGRSLVNEATTMCSTSLNTLDPLRGKPLTMFNVQTYCDLPIRLYLGISAAVFSMLVLSVAFIISYHYRWFLRYKLFLLKLAILGYRELQDGRERDEFEYDINIMFFDGDEEWVANNLRPELQGRLPDFGKIVFGDDELILGMHYFDAVYYNVEKSFKTLLLLSRAAVQDHIFMTKFRIAMNHVTDTETQNLILVFLEDIPDQELPHLVRLHLSGQGAYLMWEEDEEGQEYFWNRLTKHLNSNLKVNHLIPPD